MTVSEREREEERGRGKEGKIVPFLFFSLLLSVGPESGHKDKLMEKEGGRGGTEGRREGGRVTHLIWLSNIALSAPVGSHGALSDGLLFG